MNSFNKLLDRFFPTPRCSIPIAESSQNKGVEVDDVYNSEEKNSTKLVRRDGSKLTTQDESHVYHDSPVNRPSTELKDRHEKNHRKKDAMVEAKYTGANMSRAISQFKLTESVLNYDGKSRTAGHGDESFLMTQNGKRQISEDLETIPFNRLKKRKISEQRSISSSPRTENPLKPQPSTISEVRIRSSSSSKPHSSENLRSNYKESKITESSWDPLISQTLRARPTRISTEGQEQKLSRCSDRSRDRLAQILEQHIFVHIRKSIRPFQERLSKSQRTTIGADAVRVVIEHPDFKKHFKSNGNSILPEYEVLLAAQASSYVNEQARLILGDDIVNDILHYPKTNQISSTQSPLHREITKRGSSSIADSASEQENIFCCREELDARSNSFSPSTSLSTVQTDVEIMKKSVNSPCNVAIPVRRTARSTRASNPIYTKPMKRVTRRSQHQDPAPIDDDKSRSESFLNLRRPYIRHIDRKILLGQFKGKISPEGILIDKVFNHVPFSEVETRYLVFLARKLIDKNTLECAKDMEMITDLMAGRIYLVQKIADSISYGREKFSSVRSLHGRTRSDIISFLLDTVNDTVSEYYTTKSMKGISQIESKCTRTKFNPINRLIRHREVDGLYPARIRRGQSSYHEIVSCFLEDSLVPQSEWSDCSNDIAAITWINDDAFIVGALAHSDPHNMQYNKPGNLLLGSVSRDTLQCYPHHRIERPIVSEHQNLENSLDSMRATQSHWLYTSVVSSAHSKISGFSFTSSYDNTVKVWKVLKDSSAMVLHATWVHDARVNFVVTSEHHDRVATATGTNRNAVRVYHFCKHAIEKSPYDEYGGNKSQEQSGDIHAQRPWAYQPATIKWARSSCVENLLLVGYSPRADSGDDSDIPHDKKNTGELCVWDSDDGTRFHITSARMQNVFDAVWHPTQPIFAVATSPFGNYDSDRTKTQVRIFALNEYSFISTMTLDCPALDITELTLMPNSSDKVYITASCTDGCSYVWDVARGEDPIHILRHGESIDNPEPNLPLELADAGVTFSAWGADVSRFYTGATDGKLIAWDIRKGPGNAFVRKVLELSGGISCGAFRKDFKKLLIGDSTGKIHLLGIDDSDISEDECVQVDPIHAKIFFSRNSNLQLSRIRRPKIVTPHEEPPPPKCSESIHPKKSYQEECQTLLNNGILQMYPGRGVFQGPHYINSGLYRAEAHENGDIQRPLKSMFITIQQFLQDDRLPLFSFPILSRRDRTSHTAIADQKAHVENMKLDLDFGNLTLKTREELIQDRVDFDFDEDHRFEYEPTPRSAIFRIGSGIHQKRLEGKAYRSRAAKKNYHLSFGTRSSGTEDIDELAMGA
ncbi:putative wd repeat-containing [Golovinomyces cichoracearum]|uniref:Putative wd repeat-containing n=1 Tax=Golovinomyces cichoracearum TaxID=62708 RepID=A0A420HVD7_9PEZI|nr:putative wd repeat-containing [Golovinomyces cichoracearum]